ncbi:MAG: hypothetical protein ACYC25_02965 [Paludibacter sp.]
MKTKKITTSILIIALFSLNSCAVLDKYEVSTTNIDLTTFEQQGLFVTTGDLSKEYESISIISVNCYNGYIPKNKKSVVKKKLADDLYTSGSVSYDKIKDYNLEYCSLEDLFLEIINQAKLKGANGIIKLEIKNISRPSLVGKSIQSGVEVSGLAVRINK